MPIGAVPIAVADLTVVPIVGVELTAAVVASLSSAFAELTVSSLVTAISRVVDGLQNFAGFAVAAATTPVVASAFVEVVVE